MMGVQPVMQGPPYAGMNFSEPSKTRICAEEGCGMEENGGEAGS